MDIIAFIAEEKIKAAIDKGVFENLPGSGKPLVFEDETWVPEDKRMAYRVLKNAGFLPPELELRKEILSLRELIDTIDDDKVRLRKIRELNFLITKLNMERERSLNFVGYEDRFFEKTVYK